MTADQKFNNVWTLAHRAAIRVGMYDPLAYADAQAEAMGVRPSMMLSVAEAQRERVRRAAESARASL
jgi:hypothetical protein